MLPKLKILFLCTGNSCRSQMAEGWARRILADRVEPYSAGTAPGRVDRRAVEAMRERGVDIGEARSKHLDDLAAIEFDWVITVCGRANESCPSFPGTPRRLHVGFDDPPRLAAAASSDSEAMAPYRRVRDEIRDFIEHLPQRLAEARAEDAPR